jgi:hypothetical protein
MVSGCEWLSPTTEMIIDGIHAGLAYLAGIRLVPVLAIGRNTAPTPTCLWLHERENETPARRGGPTGVSGHVGQNGATLWRGF